MSKAKSLMAAFALVIAISAVGATTATAAEFHSEATHTEEHLEEITLIVFNTDPGKITFEEVTEFVTTTSITVGRWWIQIVEYEGAALHTIFGKINATVNMNGCSYELGADGTMHIVCPAGKAITVSGPGCTITIPAQTISNAASYTNTGSGSSRDIDVVTNVSGLAYSYSGFTCGSGSGTKNGTMTGTLTADGTSGIWWQ